MERDCPKCRSPMTKLTHRFFSDPATKWNGSPGWELAGLTTGAQVSWRCEKCGHQTKREVETY